MNYIANTASLVAEGKSCIRFSIFPYFFQTAAWMRLSLPHRYRSRHMLMKSGINALRCGCDQRRAMQMIHITIRMRYLLEHRKFLALAPVGCGGVRAAALTDSMSGKFCCDLNCATNGEEAIRAAHSRMHNFLKVNPYKKVKCVVPISWPTIGFGPWTSRFI